VQIYELHEIIEVTLCHKGCLRLMFVLPKHIGAFLLNLFEYVKNVTKQNVKKIQK